MVQQIKNPRGATTILNEIVTNLNNSGIFFSRLNPNLYTLIIEYYMRKLKIDNSRIEYTKLDKGELARVSENGNIISISQNMLNDKNQINLTTSIAHELKHINQKNTPKRYKTANTTETNMYPIKKCTLDSYQIDFNGEINPHDYYITSLSEKEARDYANLQTLKLLEDIKLHKNANKKTEQWANKQIIILTKLIEKEDEQFAHSIEEVLKTYPKLEYIIPGKIDLALSQMETKFATLNTVIGNSRTFDKYLYFYSNENITKKILNFAQKTKDIDSLITCINHPNTNITEQDFLNMLTVYNPNGKITDTNTLSILLDNWTIEEITRLCKLYNKRFEHTQTNTKNKKISKLKKHSQEKSLPKTTTKKDEIYE